ncbi:MAG: Ser-Thr-rich GPI-anchored membrane family protein [Tunicatimonas sp.]
MHTNRLIIFGLFWLTCISATAQTAQDSLDDDTLYAMKKGAERAVQDYNAAMRELINPRISKSYRDRIVTEFTTPGNRQIFTEAAYVVYDYDSDYLPPLDNKERPVRTYLTDFNIFYQGTTAQQTLEVYYSLQRIYDVQRDAQGYYVIVDFESLYGGLLPQPRRATMRLKKQKDRWKALISYVKFNIAQEAPRAEDTAPAEPLAAAKVPAEATKEVEVTETTSGSDASSSDGDFGGRFLGTQNRYTRGKAYRIAWDASSEQPVSLDLYQGQKLVRPLQQDLTGGAYTWSVPKDLPKGGNYRFQLQPESGSPLQSGVFRIKKKTPWGLYIGVSVAVAAAAVYFLLPSDPAPNSTVEAPSRLVDPPAVPGN